MDHVASDGDAAQLLEHPTGERVGVLRRQVQPGLALDLVQTAAPGYDIHGHVGPQVIGLVLEVSDQLLHEVLEGDETDGPAVLVHDQDEVVASSPHAQKQVVGCSGLGGEHCGPGQ